MQVTVVEASCKVEHEPDAEEVMHVHEARKRVWRCEEQKVTQEVNHRKTISN